VRLLDLSPDNASPPDVMATAQRVVVVAATGFQVKATAVVASH
jgi:hypothetical protein